MFGIRLLNVVEVHSCDVCIVEWLTVLTSSGVHKAFITLSSDVRMCMRSPNIASSCSFVANNLLTLVQRTRHECVICMSLSISTFNEPEVTTAVTEKWYLWLGGNEKCDNYDKDVTIIYHINIILNTIHWKIPSRIYFMTAPIDNFTDCLIMR